MVSVFLGLLWSVALFLVNLIIRILTKALSIALRTLEKKLNSLVSKSDELKAVASGAKAVGETAEKVGKATFNIAKFGAKATMLSVKVAICLIKLLIRICELICSVVTTIASSTVAVIVFIVIPLCLMLIFIIIAIASFVIDVDLPKGSKQSGYSSEIGIGSYRYMDIDWSQDFTAKLDVIEDTYGKNERDVLEWVIICMNTQQNLEETFVPVEGYCVGNIVVESGGSANLMGGATGHPSSDYTLRNADEGVGWMYASGDGSGMGYPKADGAFQIITPSWVGFNPLYTENALYLHPIIVADTDWHTMRYYCPTVAYGTLSKYKSAVYGSSYEFSNSEDVSAINHAFDLLGVSVTDGKYAFVKNACLASYAYGALVDGAHASRQDAKHDLATSIALFVLAYCETYLEYDSVSDTYYYTELSTNLSTSVVTTMCGISPSSLTFSNAVCKAVYGTTSKGDFSERVSEEGQFGVLDKDGNSINMSIDGYLLSIMPDDAVSFYESVCDDTLDYMSNTAYLARGYYDISMLVVNNYMLETAVNLLGGRSEEVDDNWMQACKDMGLWYASNVNTYCSYKDNSMGSTYGRSWYSCPLLNGYTVGDDCSAFLTACLAKAGIMPNYKGGWGYGSSAFKFNGNATLQADLTNAGFSYIPYDSNYTPQTGDIMVMHGHVEVMAGCSGGKIYVYSWGNNYSVAAGKGLPREWTYDGYFRYWGSELEGVWRKY